MYSGREMKIRGIRERKPLPENCVMNVTKDKKTSAVETYEEIECFKNITNDDLMINIS